MMYRSRHIFTCILLCCVPLFLIQSGCTQSPKSLIQRQIRNYEKLAVAIEDGESVDKIRSLAHKVEATAVLLKEATITPEDRDKFEEQFGSEIIQVQRRVVAAHLSQGRSELEFVNDLFEDF